MKISVWRQVPDCSLNPAEVNRLTAVTTKYKIGDENILYSTGDYTHYLVITDNGI